MKDRWEETALEVAGALRLGLWLTECGVAYAEGRGCLICIKTEAPRATKLSA